MQSLGSRRYMWLLFAEFVSTLSHCPDDFTIGLRRLSSHVAVVLILNKFCKIQWRGK